MYFIELIIKKYFQKKEKTIYDSAQDEQETEYENCEHTFMPIDSTGETLSCTKCGILFKREELEKYKNKNFFIQK